MRQYKKSITNQETKEHNAPTGKKTSVSTELQRPYTWQEGNNRIRLLPQLENSKFENYFLAYEYSIYLKTKKQYEIYLNLDNEGEEFLEKVRTTLFFAKDDTETLKATTISSNPGYNLFGALDVKQALEELTELATKGSPLELHLTATPKVFFLGFLLESNSGIELFKLPGTYRPYKKGGVRQLGAGSKIVRAIEEKDINNNPRYGDPFDVEVGKIINIKVSGSPVNYVVEFEDELNLVDEQGNLIIDVDSIKPFDKLIDIATLDEMKTWLGDYLPTEAIAYLNYKGLDLPTF